MNFPLVKSLITFQLTIYDFVANSVRSFFFYRPVNTNKSNFVSFLVFVGAAASFTAKISFFETIAKREAILWSRPKRVNIQGHSKLRGSIRKREDYYPLSWSILRKLKDIYSSARLVLSQSFCLRFNWQCFGYHFLWFCRKCSENYFSTDH